MFGIDQKGVQIVIAFIAIMLMIHQIIDIRQKWKLRKKLVESGDLDPAMFM